MTTSVPGTHTSARLLVTDVDDTLLGDDAAFDAFVAAIGANPRVTVVVSSSRPLASLHRTMGTLDTEWRPTGMIGALGTEIELSGKLMSDWQRRFQSYVRRPIDAAMASLGLERHDEEFQTPLKASFAVPVGLRRAARDLINETGVPVTIIESGATNFDVIPEGAGKGAALRWVAAKLEIPLDATIAAGDSRNDADMLLAGHGIVVGNASAHLKNLLRETDVYFADRHRAAGVLEGLRHFGVSLDEEIRQ